jgi:hypothetical protein
VTTDDIPENVTLELIFRHQVTMRAELRLLRDDVNVIAAILRRVDNNQTSYRDVRALFDMHSDLRKLVEAGLGRI